jgi:HSP20 family protein
MSYTVQYKPAFDFEKMLDNIFGSDNNSCHQKPAVDIIEEKDQYTLEAELPGLTEKDVEVKVEKGILTISSAPVEKSRESGEHDSPKKSWKTNFSRSFALPKDVDLQGINGTFLNGILVLSLKKIPEEKPRKIKVKAA